MPADLHRAVPYNTGLPGLVAMSLASNRVFPRHSHDQFGIGVIAAGGHRSWSGTGWVDALAGDIITVNPGEMHDGAPLDATGRTWHMLYFDPGLLRQVAEVPPASVELTRPTFRDAHLGEQLTQLFRQVVSAPGDTLAVEEHCCRLLGQAFDRHASCRLDMPAVPGNIARVRQRLDDAPQQSVTLAELAGIAGVSHYQLLRGFTRMLGITPHAYLLQRRVLEARRLIAAGHSLCQAALEAGFADQSHMTRAFVRQFGLSPGRYRRALCRV